MNITIKRLIISLVVSLAVYFLLNTIVHQLSGAAQQGAAFAIIFIGVAIAAFSAGGSRAAASASSSSGTETGTVKWFNVKKGYGFITRDSGDDVFVHYRNIVGSGRRAISDGQRVSFIVIDGDKGLQADEVEAL